MTRRDCSSEEGAAVAEFGLSLLMLLPMVFYAIYAGEAFITSIKAQEAEIAAGWEITAYRLHDYKNGNASNLLSSAANAAAKRVSADMVDFDSFVAGNAPNGVNQTLGHAEHLGVRCTPRSGNGAGDEMPPGGLLGLGSGFLHADGWVGCRAKVEFRNRKAPEQIHGEFFQGGPKLIDSSFAFLSMCGLGKNLGGCKADGEPGFLVFTDDWGLENAKPFHVKDYGKGNPEYYNVGEEVFDAKGAAKLPAIAVTGVMAFLIGREEQGDTGKFKMGYLKTIKTKETVKSDGPTLKAHLTPVHEWASPATNNTANLSQSAYDLRNKDNYLGHPDADWNGR